MACRGVVSDTIITFRDLHEVSQIPPPHSTRTTPVLPVRPPAAQTPPREGSDTCIRQPIDMDKRQTSTVYLVAFG